MARKIQEIQQEIFDNIKADDNLVEINSTSKTAIYRLFVFVVAFSIWVLEILFDTHKKEVEDILEQKFPHRPSWYRTKALAFQYGFDLIEDTDKYYNVGFPEEQIENSKIIKYSAVTQSAGQLLIKIATESDGVLSPVSTPQKASFDAYMSEIADCGVKYIVVNHLPDILLLNLQIFRDSLVLDNNGMSIINGNFPVQDAILEYMKELPFNGELVLFDLQTKLKNIEGVRIPNIVNAESQIIDISTGEYLPPKAINVKTIPESGYFVVPNFDNVKYVV
ncbi:nucleotidyltransferase [Flavobacterium branchiarum]|uniref:Nucleotidyltransferase n=1 Tax=Flavobacterium branchiarum TaxID=1114870 RepID=A0ABV5FPT7_9FLAO|nr:nucleotidyltransferase [Flavobacterium branchiarum]MDN3673071.1 nucleotidyltransferase [Flavobacterium branchiarum]